MRAALELPAERLTFRQAVFIALELLKGASPHIAKHYDSVPNVLVSFEVTLGEYAPDVIREAVVRMLRSMKRETRDIIPDAPRLADYCEDVMCDRRRAAYEREEAARKAREQAEEAEAREMWDAMSDDDRAAVIERRREAIDRAFKRVDQEVDEDETARRNQAQIRRLA